MRAEREGSEGAGAKAWADTAVKASTLNKRGGNCGVACDQKLIDVHATLT